MGFMSKLFGTDGAYKSNIADLEKAKSEATSYYKQLASQDAMQSSENQAALKAARDMLAENNQRAAASAAVTGASDYSVAMQKQQASDAVSDMMSDMSARTSQNKQAAMNNYLNANKDYTNAIAGQRQAQAAAESAAMSGLLNSAIGAASSFVAPVPKTK